MATCILLELEKDLIHILYKHIIPNQIYVHIFNESNKFEVSRGAGVQSATVKPTGCGFDPHSRRWNIYLN